MANKPFEPRELRDSISTFERGVNHGVAEELIPRNQLFDAINTTIRGDFARVRPYFQKRALNFLNPAIAPTLYAAQIQGACYYKPLIGSECLMLSAGGRLYQFQINGGVFNVTDVTGGHAQSVNATQCWLWQAERWVIWNDGSSLPVFYDGSTTARSNYGAKTTFLTRNTAAFTVPAIGATATLTVNDATNIVVGDILTVDIRGQVQVLDITGAPNITVLNISCTPTGFVVPINLASNISWQHTTGFQLPAGRQGAYGRGRIWMTLTDGRQFVASDSVGGSSGTQALDYEDAILNITENLYLAGGGTFRTPGNLGKIQAMRFTATLDASLGQGPLQVFTQFGVFSCNTPVQRTDWQNVTNPILTESLIGAGATGQDSTTIVNGDISMRSIAGLTSLILARREFDTWGNTPFSLEVEPTLALDSESLLPWGSSIDFDNRLLQTAGTVLGPHGPYFNKIVPLNYDAVSTLGGKQPSIYDSRYWTGLNVYKLLTGIFEGDSRAFAFNWNQGTDELEIYEILTDYEEVNQPPIYDNGTQPVTFELVSGVLDGKEPRAFKSLSNGEIYVDELVGRVDFQVFWKPDQWPCWLPWYNWTECSSSERNSTTNPGFRPRMGLGETPARFFDKDNNRNLRDGYEFQVKIVITGHCTFKGGTFVMHTQPEPQVAPPAFSNICP